MVVVCLVGVLTSNRAGRVDIVGNLGERAVENCGMERNQIGWLVVDCDMFEAFDDPFPIVFRGHRNMFIPTSFIELTIWKIFADL